FSSGVSPQSLPTLATVTPLLPFDEEVLVRTRCDVRVDRVGIFRRQFAAEIGHALFSAQSSQNDLVELGMGRPRHPAKILQAAARVRPVAGRTLALEKNAALFDLSFRR